MHAPHLSAMVSSASRIVCRRAAACEALTAAAACTTGFILASRRATLRQIQASLAEISAQVRQLAARG